jgi:hypothetical protein
MSRRHDHFGKSLDMQRMLPHLALLGAVLASVTAIALHALLLPSKFVLPALSGTLMITALGIAGIALIVRAERKSPRITCWDVSGGLYLIGCCAAALAETEGILALMEEIRIRK